MDVMHLDELRRLYGREYYLLDCDGHRQFRKTHGVKLPRRLAKCLALLDVQRKNRVLDIGCGRGELALHAARLGAVCLAVDPSRDGLDLLGEAMTTWDIDASHRPWRLGARGEQLPIRSEQIDGAILSDVVEHLEPSALDALLLERYRVLRPGGRLVIHTQPNRLLVQYAAPVLRRFSFLWGVHLPRDLRDEMTPGARRPYHVNEQSRGDLEKNLQGAGFEIDELWLEGSYPVHRCFGDTTLKRWIMPRFRRMAWLKELLASQLFAVARPTT